MPCNRRNTSANAPVTCSLTSSWFLRKENYWEESGLFHKESNVAYIAAQLWALRASSPASNPNGLPLNMLLLISSSKSHSWHFCSVWLHSGGMKRLCKRREQVGENQDDQTRKCVEAEHGIRQGLENDIVLSDHMLREEWVSLKCVIIPASHRRQETPAARASLSKASRTGHAAAGSLRKPHEVQD